MVDKPENPEDDDLPSNGGYADEGYEVESGDEESVSTLGKGPAVAAAPGKALMIAVVGTLLVGFLGYQIFFSSDDAGEAPPPPKPPEAAPIAQADIPVPQISIEPPAPPPPPEPPPMPDLPPVPDLPPPPDVGTVDLPAPGPDNEQMMARRKAPMLLVAGQAKPAIDAGDTNPLGEAANGGIVYGSDQDKFKSPAQRAVATHVGDLQKLILQGKIIHAVLETAIDTTFPGPIRGLVTRDVYAESGKDVLIPKGTRLIGTYNADVVRGQARIFIVWNRVIRPDGVDLDLTSPGVDNLGRAGTNGMVDNRYFEIFSGAMLTSVFTIGMAAVAQSITGAEATTSTQDPSGGQTQTGDPTSAAIQEAVTNMAGTAQRVLGGLIDARPLITVDQGTPVNVFVNKDLEFPDEVTQRIKLVQ
jgi:type IV secretion system protein VirB10